MIRWLRDREAHPTEGRLAGNGGKGAVTLTEITQHFANGLVSGAVIALPALGRAIANT
jgi:hypothetical protein